MAKKSESRRQRQGLYKSRRYQHLRLRFMAEHPLCAFCGKLSRVLDHIEPHRGNEILFWADSNWQALCKRCHDGTKRKIENEADALNNLKSGPDGWPIDKDGW